MSCEDELLTNSMCFACVTNWIIKDQVRMIVTVEKCLQNPW